MAPPEPRTGAQGATLTTKGDAVALSFKMDPDTCGLDAELIEEAAKHLARYKLPKAIIPVEQIVRSASGKPDYRWAKAQAAGTKA
jgi:fatty-acyl-CoA synthase